MKNKLSMNKKLLLEIKELLQDYWIERWKQLSKKKPF